MNKESLTNLKQTLKRNKEFTTLDVIEQLEQQNEKMKCCYNCNYGQVWADGVYCSVSGEAEHLSDYSRERALYCDKWEFAE